MIDLPAIERIATLPGNPYAGVLKGLCARIRELEPPPPVEPTPVEAAFEPTFCTANDECDDVATAGGFCSRHNADRSRRRETMYAILASGKLRCRAHDRPALAIRSDGTGWDVAFCDACEVMP